MGDGELALTKDDSRPADFRVMPSRELSSIATGTGTEWGDTGLSVGFSAMLGRLLETSTGFFSCDCFSSFEKTLVTLDPMSGVSHTGVAPLGSDAPREVLKLLNTGIWSDSFRKDSTLALGASLLNLRGAMFFLFGLSSRSAILDLSIALSAFHSFRSFSNTSLSLSKLSL